MMRLRGLGAGFVVGALLLAGCANAGSENSSGSASAEPHRGGVATLGVHYEPPSMDPAICGGSSGFSHCQPVFDTLLRYDYTSQKFLPQLAQSFETTDGKTWTLKLREGVTFSDGTPLNADAVVFNWDRIRDPKTLSPALRAVGGMSWKKVDDLTVEVTLEQVNYQLPGKLALQLGFIGSPTAIRNAGAQAGSKPVGAGPFTLTTWTRGTEAVYAANPHYWQKGRPYLDGLVVKDINDDNQRLNAFMAGDLSVNVSPRTQESKIAKDAGYEVTGPVPMIAGTGLGMNFRDPLLQDDDLRMALLHALDAEQIVHALYPGDPAPDALLTPDDPNRDDKAGGHYPTFDLQAAQERFDAYLKRAGKSSETLTLTAFTSPLLAQAAQVIQAQLGKIKGLTVKLDSVDTPTLVSRLTAGKFQLVQGSSNLAVSDGIYDTYHTNGTLNSYGYSNPKVDEALDVTRTSNDPKVVAAAYGRAAAEISQDPPLRYYRYYSAHVWQQHSVHDLTLTVFGSGVGVYWDNAWLDK